MRDPQRKGQPTSEKRACYAARIYSKHHRVRCIVFKREGHFIYDQVTPSTPLWNREIIAEYVNGEPVDKSGL